MSVINKGTVTAQEQPGSGTKENGSQVTLKYKGTKATVEALLPQYGTKYTYEDRRYVVRKVTLTPGRGGLAEGVVVLGPSDNTGTAEDGALEVTWEIEMAQLERPLLSHPLFKDVADIVQKWEASPAKFKNANQYEDTDGNGINVTDPAAILAISKIRRGIESYLTFTPVVARIALYSSRPSGVGAGMSRVGKPDVRASGSWSYIKTGDKCVQSSDGSWTRTEQWTGADEWDSDLYGSEDDE